MTPDTTQDTESPPRPGDEGWDPPGELAHREMEDLLGKKLPAKCELVGLGDRMYGKAGRCWYLLSNEMAS